MQFQSIKSIKKLGIQNTLDFKVDHKDHNFYAEGIVVSNSHAISYASMCAATVYLKFKYPKEFYLELLKLTKDEPSPIEEITKIQSELPYFNIQLSGPHIIKSDINFKIEGNNLRFGLSSIKGIAEKTITKLLNFRHSYSNKFDIMAASEEAELSISTLSSLIACGCLDDNSYNTTRSKLMYESQVYRLLTSKEKKYIHQFGPQFNFDLVKTIKFLLETKNEKGKLIIKPSRFETIKKHSSSYQQIYEFNKKNEEYASWFFERTLLGYSYSTNLLKIFKPHCPDLISVLEASQTFERDRVHIIGEIIELKEWKSREKKLPCMKIKIQDHTGNCEVLFVNSDTEDRIGEIIENNGRKSKEGDIVIIRASKGFDILFGKSLSIQQNEVFMRISQLKDIELTKIPENIS